MQLRIEVEGLKEMTRALKAINSELPKGVRTALNSAADVVVQYGKKKMPKRTGLASNTIKAKSTRTLIRVSEGSKKAPYVPWLDFGGRTGRRKSVVRPFYKDGRYLYPALGDKRDEINAALENALTDLVKKSGLEIE
jgi:hypothetical protein